MGDDGSRGCLSQELRSVIVGIESYHLPVAEASSMREKWSSMVSDLQQSPGGLHKCLFFPLCLSLLWVLVLFVPQTVISWSSNMELALLEGEDTTSGA